MTASKFSIGVILITMAFGFFSCELFLGESGSAGISIDLGIDDAGRAIIGSPAGVVSYSVTVSGPGMATIEKTIPKGTRYVNMQIPAGRDRLVRLDANLDPGYMASIGREHLLSYADETIVDLRPGVYSMVVFRMHEGRMKLVIPDPNHQPAGNPAPSPFPAVDRIPSMRPTTYFDQSQFWEQGLAGYETVTDLEYETHGVIMIARGTTYLYRYSSIDFQTNLYDRPLPLGSFAVSYIAFDQDSERLYMYGYDSGLYAWVLRYTTQYLDNTGSIPSMGVLPLPAAITPASVTSMEILDGVCYLTSITYQPTIARVFRFPLYSSSAIGGSSPELYNPTDILVKGKYVYVTNHQTSWRAPDETTSIEVFDKDTLDHVGSFGITTHSAYDSQPGHFYGARFFIAPSNKKIYVIDDGENVFGDDYGSNGMNRIVAFDDIFSWSGWETLHAGDIPGNEVFPDGSGGAPFCFFE